MVGKYGWQYKPAFAHVKRMSASHGSAGWQLLSPRRQLPPSDQEPWPAACPRTTIEYIRGTRRPVNSIALPFKMKEMSTAFQSGQSRSVSVRHRERTHTLLPVCLATYTQDQRRSTCHTASCSNRAGLNRRECLLGSGLIISTALLPTLKAQAAKVAVPGLEGIEVFHLNDTYTLTKS